ncbi:MAG: hypothetical protein U0894_07810 [Pirellulales bacterium]
MLLDLGLSRLVVGTKALKEPDWFREMCRKFLKAGRWGLMREWDGGHGWLARDFEDGCRFDGQGL